MPNWREFAAARKKAKKYFDTMSTTDRWAYWADECSLFDIFEEKIPRLVRGAICDMVNTWVADPGAHVTDAWEGGVGS